MAKELLWFKFSPAHWMMGRIQRQPDAVQAIYIRLMCTYWHNKGVISAEEAQLECGPEAYASLINFKFIHVEDGFIKINFLEEQLEEINQTKAQNSAAGKKSAEVRKERTAAKAPENKSTTVREPLNEVKAAVDLPLTPVQGDDIKPVNSLAYDYYVLPNGDKIYNDISAIETEMLQASKWQSDFAISAGLKPDEIQPYIKAFFVECRGQGKKHEKLSDAKSHCLNWSRIKKRNGGLSVVSENHTPAPAGKTEVKETALARRTRLMKEREEQNANAGSTNIQTP